MKIIKTKIHKFKNKTTFTKTQTRETQIIQKKKKKSKNDRKILPQEQKEKFTYRESSRLRNQPRKNYKTFIPQSKILKKVEFHN